MCCSVSFADEVVFKNGERLIGKFKRVEGGKLIFQSQTMGEVIVNISNVNDIYSDKLLEIHLYDDTVLKGKTFKVESNRVTIDAEEEGQEITFAMGDLFAINLPSKKSIIWSGNIAAGLSSSHGSSFSENLNIDWNLAIRSRKHRVRIDGRFVLERDEDKDTGNKQTTKENLTVSGMYNFFFTRKIFGFLNERYKKDRFDDLDYRIISVLGAGYQWIETEELEFDTRGGLGLRLEKYTSKVPDPAGGEFAIIAVDNGLAHEIRAVDKKVVDKKEELIIHAAYYFEWKPFDKFSFLSSMTYTPAFEDFSDYNITHDAEIRAFITKRLYTSFKFILDYTSDPGEDSATTDTDYILGIGWQF
jgi:putative salt-induced outer membrane protein YdiY